MKAIVYEKYGLTDVLNLREIDQPVPKEDEVLVKIHTASVNNWDWDRLTGKPYLYRLLSGITKPKLPILGCDIAGTVVEVGKGVTKFKDGDQVFGDLSEGNWGAFAEYACASQNELTPKPAFLSFEEAAAIPQAGVMALQGIRKKKDLKAGDKVLMNGAAGAVGSFVLQMARAMDYEITGVDHGNKADFMKSLGADHTIDYTRENFTMNGKKYDLIIDVVANQSVATYKNSLTSNGVYAMIGGKIPSAIGIGLLGPFYSKKGGRQIGILGIKTNQGLGDIVEMIESGKIKPVIDKVFPLEKTAEAIQRIGDGTVLGKVLIKM